jgi:hypothetical protein
MARLPGRGCTTCKEKEKREKEKGIWNALRRGLKLAERLAFSMRTKQQLCKTDPGFGWLHQTQLMQLNLCAFVKLALKL